MASTSPGSGSAVRSPAPVPHVDFGAAGPALAFLHANGYPPACYGPLLALLATHYRVLAVEQRPLWSGADPADLNSWLPLTDDLLRFVQESRETSLLGLGHSLGANVLLRAALDKPQAFRALILIDPVLFTPAVIRAWRVMLGMKIASLIHPRVRSARRRRAWFESPEVAFARFRRRAVFQRLDDAALRACIGGMLTAKNGSWGLRFTPDWEARIYLTSIWTDLEIWRSMATLAVPCAFVRGAESDTFRASAVRKIRRSLPSAPILELGGATHLVPLERPREVARFILEFFGKVAG